MNILSKFVNAVPVAVFFILSLTACDRSGSPLERSILSSNWQAVAAAATTQPILKGQALLAQNHNDESVCAFASASSQDLQDWDAWTARFLARNSKRAIAHYLRGDALARKRWPSEAEAEFDQALRLDPKLALALNARGALRSSKHDWQGLTDLRDATDASPGLADAWSNLGFALLDSKQSVDGAADSFKKALGTSPGFTLASVGSNFADLIGHASHADSALEELKKTAEAHSCAIPLLADNIKKLLDWVSGLSDGEVTSGGKNPGTLMDSDLKDLKSGNTKVLGKISLLSNDHPELVPKFDTAIKEIHAQNPALYQQIQRQLRNDANFVRPGGPAELITGILGTINGQLGGQVGIKGGAALDAHIGGSLKPLANYYQNQTVSARNGYQMMMIKGGLAPSPGGATTDMSSGRLDRGDWPLQPIYGLLYPDVSGSQ